MTIKDIAKLSGYAVGTVSRALNNQPNVSETARKAILEVAEKNNFVRNTNAQHLKMQGRYIAILVKGVSNILLNSILEIIQKKIGETIYTSSVYVLDEYDNEAKTALKIYYEKRPAGIIFLGGNPERYEADFNQIKVPCVLITNQANNVSNKMLSSVGTDDISAAQEIAELGYTGVALGGLKRVTVGIDAHGAEFVAVKGLPAIAGTLLDKKYGTW